MHSRLQDGIAILGLGVVAALAVGLTSLGSGEVLVGAPGTGAYAQVWAAWCYARPGPDPATLLGYPEGETVRISDPVHAWVASILSHARPLGQAHNVACWLQVLFAAVASFGLMRGMGISRRVAAVGAAAFACCPLAQSLGLGSSHPEALDGGFLALFWLAGWQAWRRPSLAAAAGAGAALAACALGGPTLLLSAELSAACWIATHGAWRVLAAWWLFASPSRSLGATRRMLRHLGKGVPWKELLVFAAVALGGKIWLASCYAAAGGADSFGGAESFWERSADGVARASAAPGDLLAPRGDLKHPLTEQAAATTPYLGISLLLLALAGCVVGSPEGRLGRLALAATGLGFWLLARGPYLEVAGAAGQWGARPNFWYWGWSLLSPTLARLTVPLILGLPLMLCVAVLAAHGLQAALEKLPDRSRWMLVVAAAAVICLDLGHLSPAVYPALTSAGRIPEADRSIPQGLDVAAVLDLPSPLLGDRALLFQTRHGRPIPYRSDGSLEPDVRSNGLVAAINALASAQNPGEGTDQGARDLAASGIRWVVLHPEQMGGKAVQESASRLLRHFFGEPQRFGDGTELYATF